MVQGQFTGYSGGFNSPVVTHGIANAQFPLAYWVVPIPLPFGETVLQATDREISVLKARMNDAYSVTVQNLARALNEMNERGFLTVGLDSQGQESLGAVALSQPLALVLGAEGKGLRQLTRETCRVVARLDMPGEIKSLNVSNAAVLALYIGASRLGLMG